MVEGTKGKEKIIVTVLRVAVFAVILPVLIGCCYTYLSGDDFSFEAGGNDMVRAHGFLLGPLIRDWEYCNSSEGSFWANFLVHFIRPYTYWGIMGHPLAMVTNAVLFFAALAFFLRAVFEKNPVFRYGILLVSVICAVQLAGTENDMELFFWYTGAMYYTIELTMMLFASGLCVFAIREEKPAKRRAFLIIAAVNGYLASGGNVMITTVGCAMLLIILLFHWNKKEERRRALVPFLGALAGGLTNVFLPGNWRRLAGDAVEGHTSFGDAVRDTMITYFPEMLKVLQSPVFVLLLVCVFAAALFYRIKIRPSGMTVVWLVVVFAGLLLLRLMLVFCACFGTHKPMLAHLRIISTFEMTARWTYLFFVICLAQWLHEHVKADKQKLLRIAVAVLAVLAVGNCLVFRDRVKADIKDGFSYEILADLRHGEKQENYAIQTYVLTSLALVPKDTDGIVWKPKTTVGRTAYSVGLSADCEEFYNRSAAGMFGLHTVTVLHP